MSDVTTAKRKAVTKAARNVAVDVQSVSKRFGTGPDQVAALDDVSVQIAENEFFTLLGPSGCGKTTLLRLIAGFEQPSSGHILLEGREIAGLPPYQRPVNTVFQNYALFPHMTVAGNIAFGLEMLGKPRTEIDETVTQMLRLVRMEELRNRKTSQISGGQQQRVALARALAPRPKVLLLDEPLSALDLKLRKEMQIELKRLQAETGITFIFVTHDQEEALTMSDRIAVMSKGKILQVGSPREIYDHPADRFVANFIGETNFLTGKLIAPGRVKLDAGLEIAASARAGFSPKGQVTVVIRPEHASLAKPSKDALSGTLETIAYFGTDTHYHVRLTDGVSFTVREQNNRGTAIPFSEGDKVSIRLGDNAAQMLEN
jgi:spermidine/putrescine transport system ATP-binding protein